jgi:hypothetical protein
MFLHQNSHFNNGVLILLDEDPYAQSIPLPTISLRISPIHEKSKVVYTLRDRNNVSENIIGAKRREACSES